MVKIAERASNAGPSIALFDRSFTRSDAEQAVQKAYQGYKKGWDPASKGLSFTKHSAKVIKGMAGKGSRAVAIVPKVLTAIKVVGVAAIPLALDAALKDGIKVVDAARLSDVEGAAVSGLSMVIGAGDILDSSFNLTEGILELASHPAIKWMSEAGLPLGYALSSLGIVTRGYSIYSIQDFMREFNSDPVLSQPYNEESRGAYEKAFRNLLQARLGVTPDEMRKIEKKSKKQSAPLEWQKREIERIEKRKENRMSRIFSSKTAGHMKELRAILADGPLNENQIQASAALASNIKTLAFRTTMEKTIGIAANIITIVGLILISCAAGPVAPFVFLALAALVRIGLYIYSEYFKERGLAEVNFNPKPIELPEQPLIEQAAT